MNRAILVGRVGKDPDIKKFDNGGQIASFSLATTARWKNKEGEKQERTEWHNIVISGKLSDIAAKYINKGNQVLIEGEIRYREYEKEGEKKYITEIFCNNLELLSSKEKSESAHTADTHTVMPEIFVSSQEDDLPF